MAKRKQNKLNPVGTYAESISDFRNRQNKVGTYNQRKNNVLNYLNEIKKRQERLQSEAKTKAWQQAYNDAKYSPDGIDRSYQVYAAKLISETPGALEKEQARQRRMSTAETEKMQKLVQDLQYGYGGRYDPALAYQAAQQGVKADKVRSIVNENEKTYQTLDRLSKEYEAQKGLTYQGVKDNRQKNKTGYNYTLEQDFNQRALNRQNQAARLLDNGTDPFYMSAEGRKVYRDEAEKAAAERRAKAKEYEAWDQDAALSGLYEKFYQKDLANEQAILDNPVYKGTPYETNAQARKAELESGYNAGWRDATERAQRLLDSGNISLEGKTPEEQRQIRRMVYESIMPDSYDDRIKTKNDLEQTNAIIDEYIAGLSAPWGKGSQGDAISAMEREASAYDSLVKEADNAQKYYDFMDRFRTLADGMDMNTGYDESLLPALPKMIYNQSADDFVPEPQGSEIDKAYWYANNWQTMGNYKDNMLGFESKYMFIASDPEILKMFNEFYAKDHENKLDRLHGLTGTNYTEQFLKGLEPYLSTMLVDYQDKKIRSMSENPVSGIPMRIVSPIMNAAGGIAGTLGAITGHKKDSNLYLMSRIASTARSQQNEDVGEWADRVFGGGGDVAKFVLGVVDSIADNVFAMGTGTALAGQGTKGAMRLVQLIMSGSATSNKMIESLDNGMDPTEAALYAVGDGVIEWLTERYSLEQIMGPDIKQLVGNKKALASFIARSAAAEGSEEIASDLLNMGLDSILSLAYGHEDEIKKRYNELVTQYNMTDAQAMQQAMEEKLRDIGLSGLAGALSGLGMAGSRVVSNAISEKAVGSKIQKSESNVQNILNSVKGMDQQTDSYKLADELSQKIEKGEKLSNYDVGRLAQMAMMESDEQIQEKVHSIIRDRVNEDLQGNSEQRDMAEIITKALEDPKGTEGLTKEERSKLNANHDALQVYYKYNYSQSESRQQLKEEIKTGTQSENKVQDSIAEIFKEKKPVRGTGNIAKFASQEDIRQAEAQSQRTGGMREVIVDGKFANIQQVKVEKVNGKWQTKVQLEDGRTVDTSQILATNYGAAQIVNQAAISPEFYSEKYTNMLLKAQEEGRLEADEKALDDATAVRIAAYIGNKVPQTSLDKRLANEIWMQSVQEHAENGKKNAVTPVKGTVKYKGMEYGTTEYNKAVKEIAEPTLRNAVDMIGSFFHKAGLELNMDDMQDDSVYGTYDTKTQGISINLFGKNYTVDGEADTPHNIVVTAGHELTHWLKDVAPAAYKRLEQYVMQSYAKKDYNELVKRLNHFMYQDGLDLEGAIDEIVANSSDQVLGDEQTVNQIRETDTKLFDKLRDFVQVITDKVKSALFGMQESASKDARFMIANGVNRIHKLWWGTFDEALSRAEQGTTAKAQPAEGQVKNSKAENAEFMKPFAEQLDDYMNPDIDNKEVFRMDSLVVSSAPKVFTDIGLPKLPVTINQEHINKALYGENVDEQYKDSHMFTPEELKKLPEKIAHPIAIGYDPQSTKQVIVYVDMKSNSGEQVIVPLRIGGIANIDNTRNNTLKLDTTMSPINNRGKELLESAIKQNNEGNVTLFYINKKQAAASGLRYDILNIVRGLDSGLIHSINDEGSKVKVNVQTQTDSLQFKRWFGNSKIVNEDGTPKIMYHGTLNGGFDVFGGRNDFWYFSDSKDYAKVFAGRNNNNTWAKGIRDDILNGKYKPQVYEVYLSVQNPFVTDDQDIIEDALYWDHTLAQQLRDKGYDALMLKDQSQVIVLNPNQIKSATDNIGTFSKKTNNIKFSKAELDDEYSKAVESGNTERQQELVDQAAEEAGYTIKAYHGTGRADRVGTVFLPERATSGPMAYFTDSREIAENYARDKKDTSIAYDETYGDYHTQFRYNLNGKDIPVSKLWDRLDWKSRQKVIEAAKHINFDDDLEEIIYDEDAQYGPGGFTENELRYHRGNAIDTLIYVWLDSANLMDREQDFLKVLDMAGIKNVKWNNPDARVEKVYDTYLKINNPFDTSEKYTQEFVDGLLEWWDEQDQEQYDKESMDSDFWDKNNITVEEWADIAKDDIEKGGAHNFTRIPDAVSDYIKSLGYDGIKDMGGKGGGAGHTVWIPFSSEQIKSADPVTYDNNGKVIPLSERFNESNNDIRWSKAEDSDAMDAGLWLATVSPWSGLQTEDERTLQQAYKDRRLSISLNLYKQNEVKEKIRKLESRENLDNEGMNELANLKDKLVKLQEELGKKEEELQKITSKEGFAGIMYRQKTILNDYVAGRTQDQVLDSVESMLQEVEEARAEIAKRTEELKELANTQAVKAMRAYLNKGSLKQQAEQLANDWHTAMPRTEIQNRLAAMALKLASGQDITTEAETLAADMMNTLRGVHNEELENLRGVTLTIGKSLADELKAEHSSLKEIQQQIHGSGIRIIEGEETSRLVSQWADLRENNKSLPEISGPDIDVLHDIVDYITGQMQGMSGEQVYGEQINMEEVTAAAYMAAASVSLNMVQDPAAKRIISGLMGQIKELSRKQGEIVENMTALNEKMAEAMSAGVRAKSWAGVLQNDVDSAIKYYNEVAKLAAKEEKAKVRKDVAEHLRSENAKKLYQQKEMYEQQLKDSRKARVTAEENQTLRSRINTNISRLKKRLTEETDRQNIPEETKALARYLCGKLVNHDMTDGLRRILFADKKQLQDFSERLKRMHAQDGGFDAERDLDWLVIKAPNAEDNDYTLRDKIVQDLRSIDNGLLMYWTAEGNGLNSLENRREALNEISEAVAEITGAIRARGQAFINNKRYELADLAERAEDEMNRSKFKGERVGFGSGAMNAIEKGIGYGNMTPEYFFKKLKNSVMTMLHKGFNNAENRSGLMAAEIQGKMEEIAEQTGFRTWDGQEKHKIKVNGGREITITTEQLMALYATWQREKNNIRPEATAHLLRGGFVLAQEDRSKGKPGRQIDDRRPVRMSKEQLDSLGDMLTEQQKAYVDAIVEYMSTDLADVANETSMETYGIKKFTEKYYFPVKSWRGVLSKESNRGISNQNDNAAMRQSFTKRITAGAQNTIEIGDFTPTAMRHMAGMITFNTVGPAVENLNKVLNYQLKYGDVTYDEAGEVDEDTTYKQSVRASFQQAYGKNALEYLEQFMKDINGGTAQGTGSTVFDKLLSTFRKGAVAGSLSVALQQPLSYIRAAMMINPKYLAGAIAPWNWGKIHEEMTKYSGIAVIKDMGRFDMQLGRSMIDFITPDGKQSGLKTAWTKFSDATTVLPEKMDAITWGRMWIACKMEQAAQQPGVDQSSEAFLQKVAERFNEVMRRTQVYDSVMVKSQNMRNKNPIIKGITSFMAEPTLSLNVLEDAVKNAGEKGGKLNLAKAGATFMLSAVMQALVKGLMSSGRSPDEKKTWQEQFLTKWFTAFMSEANPASLIPGYSDVIELLKSGELSNDALGVIGKVKTIAQTTINGLTGKGKGIYRDLEDTAGQIAQIFTNVPVKNIMRDVRAMYNFFNPDTYANRATSGAVIKYGMTDAFFTADNMLGTVNTYLQMAEAGYGTAKKDYIQRLYEAQKAGRTEEARDLMDYLVNAKVSEPKNGTKEDTINSSLRTLIKNDEEMNYKEKIRSLRDKGMKNSDIASWIKQEYKEGRITKEEGKKLYVEANPAKTENDAYFLFEQAEYEELNNVDMSDSVYFRLNEALKKNDLRGVERATDELLKHGKTEDEVKEKKKKYVTDLFKDGKLKQKQAEEQLKKWRPDLDANDVFWTLDLINYKKETGKEKASGKYYRLTDAINANKDEQIKKAVKDLLGHGVEAKKVKDKLSDWKSEYLAGDQTARRKIRDALQKAYKALGLTAADADKVINGWTKKTKKTK